MSDSKISRRKYLKLGVGAVAAAAIGTAGYYLSRSQPTASTTIRATTTSASAVGAIKIGAFAPLTGVAAYDGNQLVMGIKLAIKEINDNGGMTVGGKKYVLEATYYDTEGKVETSNAVLLKAIQQDKINFATGYNLSTEFISVMDIYQRYGVPVVDCCAASTSIFQKIQEQNMKYVFMSSPSTIDIANGMVGAAVDLFKPKAIAIVHSETEGGRSVATNMKAWLQTNSPNTKIVVEEYLPPDTTNFTATLSKVKAAAADVLSSSFDGEAPNAAIFQQIYELKVPVVVTHNGSSIVGKEFFDKYGKYLEGNITLSRVVIGKVYTPKTQAFYDNFRKMFNADPIQWGLQSYDSMYILADAIQRAGSLDPDAVSKALEDTHYTGAWKKDWSFEKATHRSPALLTVSQFQNGKWVPVWPSDISEKLAPIPPYAWQK